MHNTLVSIVLPTYNGGSGYLDQAVQSCLKQTYSNWELIIVDDGSTDDTPVRIAQYVAKNGRIRSVRHETNRKLPAALNTGFSEAKGDYLTWTSDDNCYRPQALAEMVAFLKSHPDVKIVYTDYMVIDEFGQPVDFVTAPRPDRLTVHNCIGSCFLYQRQVQETIGKYSEDLFTAEDYDFWLRASVRFQLQPLHRDLYLYRRHNASLTHYQTERICLVTEKSLKHNLPLMDWMSNTLRAKSYLNLARMAHARNDLVAACSYLFYAVYYSPNFVLRQISLRSLVQVLTYFRITYLLQVIKNQLKKILGPQITEKLRCIKRKLRTIIEGRLEKIHVRSPFRIKLQTELKTNFKIGMAVLAHERPDCLELCLDSLFRTKLYDYDITFLIQDDGSKDPRVREIIERERDPQYKIIRDCTPRGHNSWAAAFNKAIRRLMEIDEFGIIGTCDSDALFHPEWLDKTMKICLWAKKNHKDHILGPFSSFNSSDVQFHGVLGTYNSPEGNYVVKCRMGALNYFYSKHDFLKLGFFEESKDDETLMTQKFEKLKVRNFCTETSYVEHIGRKKSILDQWRPVPVREKAVHALNLAKDGWPYDMEKINSIGYYKYMENSKFDCSDLRSSLPIDTVIPVAKKDK